MVGHTSQEVRSKSQAVRGTLQFTLHHQDVARRRKFPAASRAQRVTGWQQVALHESVSVKWELTSRKSRLDEQARRDARTGAR